MNDIVKPEGRGPRPDSVRIHEVDFPVVTKDLDQLKASCLVPVYQPGVVAIDGTIGRVTDPSGRPGQVMVGHATGFNGGQALIIRETAAAFTEIRRQLDAVRSALLGIIEVQEEAMAALNVGKDGRTSMKLCNLEARIRDIRTTLFPEEREA